MNGAFGPVGVGRVGCVALGHAGAAEGALTPRAAGRRGVDPVVAAIADVEVNVLGIGVRVDPHADERQRAQVGRQGRGGVLVSLKSTALPSACCPSLFTPGFRYAEMTITFFARK